MKEQKTLKDIVIMFAAKSKIISTEDVTSKNQLADIRTRALPRPLFEDLLSKLGIQNLTLPT